jgi:ABC-2 type transport system ATP-binding protein
VTSPAISLSDVTKIYPGGVTALDSADFTVEEGERCCLLGPNGAGKTTIIRLLEGALTPTAGDIRVLGVAVHTRELIGAKRSIGIVPQSPGLYPDLTVREYLSFVRSLYKRGDVLETVERYGLTEFVDRPLSALSGGYGRRLLVATAVMSTPSLLLLDEPTVGLDPLAAAETRRLLRTEMAGRTVFMSTHNLAEAEELCDTVIILRAGQVLVHERIEEMRRQAIPHVHLAAHGGTAGLQSALRDMGVDAERNGHEVVFTLLEAERAVPDLLRGLLNAGIDVYESRIVPPTLEDLFVEVVTRR